RRDVADLGDRMLEVVLAEEVHLGGADVVGGDLADGAVAVEQGRTAVVARRRERVAGAIDELNLAVQRPRVDYDVEVGPRGVVDDVGLRSREVARRLEPEVAGRVLNRVRRQG